MSNYSQGQEVFDQLLSQIDASLSYAVVKNLEAGAAVSDVHKGCVVGALALMREKSSTMELDLVKAGSLSRNQELQELVDRAISSF